MNRPIVEPDEGYCNIISWYEKGKRHSIYCGDIVTKKSDNIFDILHKHLREDKK